MAKGSNGGGGARPNPKNKMLDEYLSNNENEEKNYIDLFDAWENATWQEREAAIKRTKWSGFVYDTGQEAKVYAMSGHNEADDVITNIFWGNVSQDDWITIGSKDGKEYTYFGSERHSFEEIKPYVTNRRTINRSKIDYIKYGGAMGQIVWIRNNAAAKRIVENQGGGYYKEGERVLKK